MRETSVVQLGWRLSSVGKARWIMSERRGEGGDRLLRDRRKLLEEIICRIVWVRLNGCNFWERDKSMGLGNVGFISSDNIINNAIR